nr:Uncharacterised protein [Klebsiella pneumoniae]
MAPGQVVEHFNVIEDIRPGQIPWYYMRFLIRSFFSELKNDSVTALSQQLPRLLMLGVRLLTGRSAASRHCRTGCPGRPSKSQAVIGILLIRLF